MSRHCSAFWRAPVGLFSVVEKGEEKIFLESRDFKQDCQCKNEAANYLFAESPDNEPV